MLVASEKEGPTMAGFEYINTEEFAEIARTSPATVRYWRHIGYGPAGVRLGRRVLYSRTEVLAWIENERAAQNPQPA
jgi:hypothetical protein